MARLLTTGRREYSTFGDRPRALRITRSSANIETGFVVGAGPIFKNVNAPFWPEPVVQRHCHGKSGYLRPARNCGSAERPVSEDNYALLIPYERCDWGYSRHRPNFGTSPNVDVCADCWKVALASLSGRSCSVRRTRSIPRIKKPSHER